MATVENSKIEAQVVALRKPSGFELELQEFSPQFARVLPSHISVEKFQRVIITALNQNPELMKADRRSLFTACIRAAQDGLLPDGREAALVMFGKIAQYMPMIHGVRKRMRNTGEVMSADAQVIYEGDHFDYRLGDEPFIEHKPALGERGKPIGAYAIIKLANGEIIREVMNVAEIEKVRKVSRAANNGPWVSWWSEMARKTVLRRCAKAAPSSPEMEVLLKRDDEIGAGLPPPPPRPTREDFIRPIEPSEPFVIVTADGEERNFDDPRDAVKAFLVLIAEQQTADTLEAIGESNTLSAQLRDRGYDDLAEQIRTTYDAATAELSAAARPSEPQPKEPRSPLQVKGADWAAWVTWAIAEIKRLTLAEANELVASRNEFDFIKENRSADWDRISSALDDRR